MPHPQANLATHLLGHATSLHDALHGLGRGFPGRHEHQRPRQVRIYMHAEHCHVQIPHLDVPCLQGGGSGLSQVGSPDGVVTGRRRGLHVAGQVSSQILLLRQAERRPPRPTHLCTAGAVAACQRLLQVLLPATAGETSGCIVATLAPCPRYVPTAALLLSARQPAPVCPPHPVKFRRFPV